MLISGKPHIRPALVGLAALAFLAGCWDYNETFENTSENNALIGLTLIVVFNPPAAEFPEIAKWYQGNQPTIVNEGDGRFRLIFQVNVPPGGSVHLGWEFRSRNVPFEVLPGFGIRLERGAMVEFSTVTLATAIDPGLGLVLKASIDPSAPEPATVTRLEWTASESALGLEDLAFGDPELEALPWASVTSDLPLVLSPGDPPRVFDAPDGALAGFGYGLSRMKIAPGAAEIGQETVLQSPLTGGATAVPTLGLAALVALAASLAAIAYLRLRRRAPGLRV